jgi:hypothetical protein
MRGPRLSWLEPGANATWPLVELTLSEGRGRFRLRVPVLRSLVRRWLPDFEFDTTTVAASLHRGAFTNGVRFVRPDGESVTFWTFSPDDVLDAVEDQRTAGD